MLGVITEKPPGSQPPAITNAKSGRISTLPPGRTVEQALANLKEASELYLAKKKFTDMAKPIHPASPQAFSGDFSFCHSVKKFAPFALFPFLQRLTLRLARFALICY